MGEALPCKEKSLSCARENEQGKLKQEGDSRQIVLYKLEREKTTQATEIEDVASKLSETRKVKPVSAV